MQLHIGALVYVSIHAPREGCDIFKSATAYDVLKFQFTHPGRGATWMEMSILGTPPCFNSRTPGGVRRP